MRTHIYTIAAGMINMEPRLNVFWRILLAFGFVNRKKMGGFTTAILCVKFGSGLILSQYTVASSDIGIYYIV